MQGYVAPSTFAITLTALAADAARESIAIDNRTTMYDDFSIQLKISPIAAGTLADDKCCYIYFYASVDGTLYDDPCTGADAAITLLSPSNLRGPFVVNMASIFPSAYEASIGSVASFFGGVVPPKWGIVVDNQTNAALNGTAGNFVSYVRGLFFTT